MFEAELKAKIKRIFDLDKVTYDQVSESMEQECSFIELDEANYSFRGVSYTGRVTGRIRVFAQGDKLPMGYFQRKIQEADYSDTQHIFFYDIESNTGIMNNLKERSMSFRYFFSGEYDPNLGTITSIEISEA